MKKIMAFVLVIGISLTPVITFGAVLGLPFGGLVLTAPVPGVSCPGGGVTSPYVLTPLGGFLPGLFTSTTGVGITVGSITPGAYILGLYLPTPIPECVGPPPLNTTFQTSIYGTNIPGL